MNTSLATTNWAAALANQVSNGLSALSSSRVFWTACIAFIAFAVMPSLGLAQTQGVGGAVDVFSGQSSANTTGLDEGLFSFVLILYRIFKVVAVIVGCLGVWRLMEQDYKWAIACATCFFGLFFMPSIVELFQSMGQGALNASR